MTTFALLTLAASAPIGAAPALDLHIGRILAALLACSLLALTLALFIRRYGPPRLNALLKTPFRAPARAIRVLESQPLSAHANVCRLSFDGREYVIVVGAGAATVLASREAEAPRS
ncbi:MAG: hypothetical protein QM759_04920 [Terricaulis sp.]